MFGIIIAIIFAIAVISFGLFILIREKKEYDEIK